MDSMIEIDALRSQIDAVDGDIMRLFAKRFSLTKDVGLVKRRCGMDVLQSGRFGEMMERRRAIAARLGLPAEFVGELFDVVHRHSVRQQEGL